MLKYKLSKKFFNKEKMENMLHPSLMFKRSYNQFNAALQ